MRLKCFESMVIVLLLLIALAKVRSQRSSTLESPAELRRYFETATAAQGHYWRTCTDEEISTGGCVFQIPECPLEVFDDKKCPQSRSMAYKCAHFDFEKFATALAGQALCMVGDSVTRQTSAYLCCYLETHFDTHRKEVTKIGRLPKWRILYANATIAHTPQHYWNPHFFDMIDESIGPCDVYVIGVGLWYSDEIPLHNLTDTEFTTMTIPPRGNLDLYAKHISWLMEEGSGRVKNGKRVAFLEPTAQHFPFKGGEFHTTNKRKERVCVPHKGPSLRRLKLFHEAARKWGIPTIRTYEPLLPRWDVHYPSDCTHFCSKSGAFDPLFTGLYRWVVDHDASIC